ATAREKLLHPFGELTEAGPAAALGHRRIQRLGEIPRTLEALPWIRRERTQNCRVELRRYAIDRRRRRDHRLADGLEGLDGRVTPEEPLAGHQFPEHHSDAEDVGSAIRAFSAKHFRLNVGVLALQH